MGAFLSLSCLATNIDTANASFGDWSLPRMPSVKSIARAASLLAMGTLNDPTNKMQPVAPVTSIMILQKSPQE